MSKKAVRVGTLAQGDVFHTMSGRRGVVEGQSRSIVGSTEGGEVIEITSPTVVLTNPVERKALHPDVLVTKG